MNSTAMKKILFVIIFFSCILSFAQEPTKVNHESFPSFLNDQTGKIDKLKDGLLMSEVKTIMGSSIIVNIQASGKMKELNQLFKQPEYTNKYRSNPALIVDVLWYFSTPKDQNGIITKNECTPVIFENDSLVGKGWPFFQTYRRTGKMR